MSKTKRDDSLSRYLLPIIISAAAVIRLFNIGSPSLWYDELYTVWASRLPVATLLQEVPASRHPPVYYLVAHVWLGLVSGDAWVRLISCMAGVIAVGLVYLIGKDLFSVRAGIWGAALTAFSPFLIWYSRDATDYSWLIAVSLGSFYLLVRSLKKGGSLNWALYCIVTFVALFSHYYAVFLFIAEIAFFIIISKHRKQIRPWLICQEIFLLALFPLVLLLRRFQSSSYEQYLNYTTP